MVTMLDWLLFYDPKAVPTASGGRYEGWTADDLPTMCPGFYTVPGAAADEPCPDILEDCDRCKECWSRDITDIIPPGTAEAVSMYIRGLREGWDRGLAALKDAVVRGLICPDAVKASERDLRILAGGGVGLKAPVDIGNCYHDTDSAIRADEEVEKVGNDEEN